MTALNTTSERTRRATLAVLLLAVVTSGIPLVEVHAHDDAHFGHSHASPDHGHDGSDPDAQLPDKHESDATAPSHAHSFDLPALTLVETLQVELVTVLHAHGELPLPDKPPDTVLAPLHRPPIA